MKKTLIALGSVAALAAGTFATTAASADPSDHRYVIIDRYCTEYDADADCVAWRTTRETWDDTRYTTFYTTHRDKVKVWYQGRTDFPDYDRDVDVIFKYTPPAPPPPPGL